MFAFNPAQKDAPQRLCKGLLTCWALGWAGEVGTEEILRQAATEMHRFLLLGHVLQDGPFGKW